MSDDFYGKIGEEAILSVLGRERTNSLGWRYEARPYRHGGAES